MNTEQVEQAFETLKENHKSLRSDATSVRDVLQYMVDRSDKIWWWAWEFLNQHNSKGRYLSHRACARASDLAIHYPDFVEGRRIGRFKVFRVRTENIDKINEFLTVKNI